MKGLVGNWRSHDSYFISSKIFKNRDDMTAALKSKSRAEVFSIDALDFLLRSGERFAQGIGKLAALNNEGKIFRAGDENNALVVDINLG